MNTFRPRLVFCLLLPSAGILLGLGLLLGDSLASTYPVLAPLAALAAICLGFFYFVWGKQAAANWFEIGAIYVAVVCLYAVYPLVGFLCNGQTYTPSNDGRLFFFAPGGEEIGTIAWFYIVHLAAFVIAYALVRGKPEPRRVHVRERDKRYLVGAVLLYAAAEFFLLATDYAYGLSATDYHESYLKTTRLPLMLAQVYHHVDGMKVTISLVLLAVLLADYRRYRFLIATWLGGLLLLSFVHLGRRMDLVLLALAAGSMYHVLVRPLSGWLVLGAGLGLLSTFIFLGLLRGVLSGVELDEALNVFAYNSEFECLFANAFDLQRLRASGEIEDLPLAFYASDLLAVVPQQLLPFAKINPGSWYVEAYYPRFAEIGGAFAFGTVAESIVGWGWIDLVIRGAALGSGLALMHRYFVNHAGSFWTFILYAWLTVQSYQLFRGSTLYLLPMFLYRFLPVVLALRFLAPLGERERQPGPASFAGRRHGNFETAMAQP